MSKREVFFGKWKDADSMWADWFYRGYGESKQPMSKEEVAARDGATILFACYGNGDYEGDAFVLLRRGKNLFEVYGGHCSCYGLEGQWKEEAVKPKELLANLEGNYRPSWVQEAPIEALAWLKGFIEKEFAK